MDKTIEKITDAIKKLEDKTFNVFFVVVDSKGVPTGSLAYIYETAKHLHDLGYNVKMLHAESEFEGVGSWLGEEYASLPHYNIEKDSVATSPADFLFIPEIYANVMSKTKDFPCHRVAILQNFGYLTEIIPMGVSWDDLKIYDCITTSESLAARLKSVFPDVLTRIVHPSIPEYFKKGDEQKKLMINVVSKNQSEINGILKPFHWKYPEYKWIAFRNVANLPRKEFADALREGFATIWCDTTTDFGYSAVEAMASGSLVIGKVPNNVPEWMGDENLKNNGLWFFNNLDAQEAIAMAIQSFITENIPDEMYKEMEDTVSAYSPERQKKEIETVYTDIFEMRKKNLTTFLSLYQKENNKSQNVEEK